MIISDLQFYDIFWKRRFWSLSLRPQDYTPEISKAFAAILANALSSLNVSSGISGHNLEHEVGHRTRYDDMDERQSGTKLSM